MHEMLDLHLQFIDKSQQKMLQYVHFIEDRLAELPCEIETGLNPKEIAKVLGESLRQHFVQSGISNTVGTLQTTAAVMGNAQKQLTGVMRELADPHYGLASQIESANRQIAYSLEQRTKTLDSLLHEFKTELLRIWIPIATGATLLIGLFAGMAIQRHTSSGFTMLCPDNAAAHRAGVHQIIELRFGISRKSAFLKISREAYFSC